MVLKKNAVGIGLRHSHYQDLFASQPALGFVEVHAENFFAAGGAALAVLDRVREHYPLSVHGVGLSLGSAGGLDPWHLDQLARLVERVQPCLVSEHACFARVPVAGGWVHAHDLLPLAFTEATLAILARHVTQVQERLKRPLLIENLSSYLSWADSAMSEPEFLNRLTRQTGCGLLLDVNNLVVNALNRSQDPVKQPCEWIDQIDAASVGQMHLAGYHDAGDIVIDDHGSAVHENVWQVFAHALKRLGHAPTLVEWDTDIPPLPTLLQEAQKARVLMAANAS